MPQRDHELGGKWRHGAVGPGRSAWAMVGLVLALSTMLWGSRAIAASAQVNNLGLEVWQSRWDLVLKRNVDSEGRVDFTRLAEDHADLDRVVAFIMDIDPVSSPALFPTADARLAYYINAYNALAMHGVLEADVPRRFGWFGRLRFFYLQTFTVGRRAISLYDLENKVIRPFGDPRVHFALNCMTVSCPRLPQAAFTAAGLDRELDTAARVFVEEPRNVAVDNGRREVTLSAIFDFYTKDFLASAPSLIAYVNRYRTEPIPSGYRVVFADYDWTINDRSRLTGGLRSPAP